MRYEYHNFTENLNAVKNSKDMAITRELMLSEIAKVIQNKPENVRRALVGCGVKVSARATRRDIVYAVSGNMARSECLRKSIMKLVLANQLPFMAPSTATTQNTTDFDTDLGRDGFMDFFGGGGSGGSGGSSGNKGISGDTALASGTQLIGSIFGLIQSNKTFKEADKQRAFEREMAQKNADLMLQQMELQASMQGNTQVQQAGMGGGANMLTWILLGVGVIAIIGFSIYSSRKKGSVKVSPKAAPTSAQ